MAYTIVSGNKPLTSIPTSISCNSIYRNALIRCQILVLNLNMLKKTKWDGAEEPAIKFFQIDSRKLLCDNVLGFSYSPPAETHAKWQKYIRTRFPNQFSINIYLYQLKLGLPLLHFALNSDQILYKCHFESYLDQKFDPWAPRGPLKLANK